MVCLSVCLSPMGVCHFSPTTLKPHSSVLAFRSHFSRNVRQFSTNKNTDWLIFLLTLEFTGEAEVLRMEEVDILEVGSRGADGSRGRRSRSAFAVRRRRNFGLDLQRKKILQYFFSC